MVRRGLRHVLDAEPDLEVTVEVGDGRAAVEAAREQHFDLFILDVAMPRLTGLQAAAELNRLDEGAKVLILSAHDNEQYFFEALRVGASGYVLKAAADRDLVRACRAVLRGERFIYPKAVRALAREYLEQAREGMKPPDELLTERQMQVVKLIAEGMINREIAEELVISEKTVERHRANILEKLGMRDRVELTRWAIRRGLIEP